jgi:tetratricopeptide (TPR) repeat protein
LLGLVTAAGGGLSAADLAHLAHTTPRLVERHLSAVTGRAFRTSKPHWRPTGREADLGEEVYLLGHEELQKTAIELLPAHEISAFRRRLHAWADQYHALDWPPDSPQYLLRGYINILRETGEHQRLLELAVNKSRHARLRHVSGTDLPALHEIDAAFELVLNESNPTGPDVKSAATLAFHRDAIYDSNRHLPHELFALWARLGMLERAINHANAQGTVERRIDALLAVAKSLIDINDSDNTGKLLEGVSRLTLEVADLTLRADLLADIAHAYVEADNQSSAIQHAEQASNLLASLPDEYLHHETLGSIARCFARLGDWDRAEIEVLRIAGKSPSAK